MSEPGGEEEEEEEEEEEGDEGGEDLHFSMLARASERFSDVDGASGVVEDSCELVAYARGSTGDEEDFDGRLASVRDGERGGERVERMRPRSSSSREQRRLIAETEA